MALNLFILDTSVLIAIFEEMDYPRFIDKLLELKHELIIPSLLLEYEAIKTSTRNAIDKYIKEGKIKIMYINTLNDILDFIRDHKPINFGETAVILAWLKLKKTVIDVYCVIDEKRARTVAKELGIEYTGTVGLLKLLKEKKILTLEELKKIIENLRKSNFRLSRRLMELLESYLT